MSAGGSGDANIRSFLDSVKLDDLTGVSVESIRSSNVMFVSSSIECTQIDVVFNMTLDYSVHIKITYPKGAHNFLNSDITKLRITISELDLNKEIKSCINYLQRQRNVQLALSILRKCLILQSERRLILDMLKLHCEAAITVKNNEDCGVVIQCTDRKTTFKYFESMWKIQFDCSNHIVMDYIDFSINSQDRLFHNEVKESMNLLIQPSVLYNNKVELWWNIVKAIKGSVQRQISCVGSWGPRDFMRVHSSKQVNVEDCEQYEILSSDEEGCIVIDD